MYIIFSIVKFKATGEYVTCSILTVIHPNV